MRHTILLTDKIDTWIKELDSYPSIFGFRISRMEYLISVILKHKQDKHPGAYSLLNMAYLRNIVPNAGEYLNFLKSRGVIEWKNYLAGRNSRLYRITKDFEGHVIFRTLTDQQLRRRIESAYSRMKSRNSRKYPLLNSYVYSVSIDSEQARHTVEEYYNYQKIQDPEKAEARRTFSLAEISKIEQGEIYIKVNTTNGRYDTNFTRLPGELVKYLAIDNTPLTEIDIANSQPFFGAGLFNPTPQVEKVMSKYLGSRLTMYIKSLNLTQYEDVMLYALLVKEGRFYDYMMQKLIDNGIPFIDRDDFKEQLFTIFFGKNSAIHYSNSVRLFKAEFPNVYRMFYCIKETSHNRLPILLTRIESNVILDNVSQRLLYELPGVKFITKHDSILPASLMVSGDVDKVMEIFSEVVVENTGLKPKLRVKGASPPFQSFFNPIINSFPLCVQNPCN